MTRHLAALLAISTALVACGTTDTATPTATESATDPGVTAAELRWIDDMRDSAEKVANLLTSTRDTANQYADNPRLWPELADILDGSADVIGTHITHFERITPPPRLAATQEQTLVAWRAMRGAYLTAATAMRSGNSAGLEDAAEQMMSASRDVDVATEMLGAFVTEVFDS